MRMLMYADWAIYARTVEEETVVLSSVVIVFYNGILDLFDSRAGPKLKTGKRHSLF